MMQRLGLGLVLVGAFAGCKETVDSADIRTGGIYADLEAVATSSGTTVGAVLKVGGSNSNTFMNIGGEDRLVATVDGDDKRMTDSNNNEDYQAVFNGVNEGGTEVEIAFLRGSDDVDAPNSRARLPEPFTLDGVGNNEVVSRTDDIVLTWEASDDELDWDLDGDCISLEFENGMTDTGTLTIPAGDVEAAFEDDEDRTCEVTFTLDRVARGSVDDNFGEGGRFLVKQRRSLRFRSAP